MHNWYAEKCPNIGLAAENGFFWRIDSKDKNEHHWTKLIKIRHIRFGKMDDIFVVYLEESHG